MLPITMTAPSTSQTVNSAKITGLSGRFAVRDALAALTERLAGWGVDTEQVSTVELVAAEALNNIVEHAFLFNDGKPFHLTVTQEPECLRLEIVDGGNPMPGLTLPDTALGKAEGPDVDVPAPLLPEGGWGWLLIRELSQELCYARNGDENHLTIVLAN